MFLSCPLHLKCFLLIQAGERNLAARPELSPDAFQMSSLPADVDGNHFLIDRRSAVRGGGQPDGQRHIDPGIAALDFELRHELAQLGRDFGQVLRRFLGLLCARRSTIGGLIIGVCTRASSS